MFFLTPNQQCQSTEGNLLFIMNETKRSVWVILQIRMPSGRYVTAQVWCTSDYDECVMNIVVYALGEDRSVSQGLCGNFDGIASNDITQAGLTYPVYAREPIQFSRHFL